MKTDVFSPSNCLLCNSSVVKAVCTNFSEFQLAQCQQCGFWFVLPRPSQQVLENVYQGFTNQMETLKFSAIKAKNNVSLWRLWLKKYAPSAKRILEIGCSSGHLLFGLKQYGYQVFGCDVSQEAVRLAKKHYDLDIFLSQFPQENQKAGFDVLLLSHLIEHLVSPKDFLKQALQFLKPQGILLLATPNLNSLGFRLFGNHYTMVSPPVHLNFFNKKTIRLLLFGSCFLVKFQTISYDSTGRNSFFYNFFASLLGMSRKPKAIPSGVPIEQPAKIVEPAPKILKIRKLLRRIIQLVLFPFFWIFDKLGLGDNLVIIARKK
jgi:SAM-dependent methyltransferase